MLTRWHVRNRRATDDEFAYYMAMWSWVDGFGRMWRYIGMHESLKVTST